jgi:hypothetical protein
VLACVSNPSTGETEAGGSQFLGYIARPSLKQEEIIISHHIVINIYNDYVSGLLFSDRVSLCSPG